MNRLCLIVVILLSTRCSFGQALVKDLNVGPASSNPCNFTRLGDHIFFVATDELHGYELWITDGTEAGTFFVSDINPGPGDACLMPGLFGNKFSNPVALGKRVYFFANDGEHGFELWRSDGTYAGTSLVKDIMPGPVSSVNDFMLVRAGNYLYFAANDGEHGLELWKTDGSDTGTAMVMDLNPGIKDGNPQSFFADSNIVYFGANDGVKGYGLWKTDGTATGTVYIKNVSVTRELNDSVPFIKYNGAIYFNGFTLDYNAELWRTNGTPEGTVLVKDINPGKEAGSPNMFRIYKNKLIFSANNGKSGFELWQSDGSNAGTVMMKDICPGTGSSNPKFLSVLNKRLFFTASDTTHNTQIWASDLSDTGTYMLKDIRGKDTISLAPQNLFVANNQAYFCGGRGEGGCELWVTDGTHDGTHMLHEICAGNCSSEPGNFYYGDSLILFAATDEMHGRELWRIGGDSTIIDEITDATNHDVYTDPLRRQLNKMARTGNGISYIKVFTLSGAELLVQDAKKPIPVSVAFFDPGIYLLRAYDKTDRVVAFVRFVKE